MDRKDFENALESGEFGEPQVLVDRDGISCEFGNGLSVRGEFAQKLLFWRDYSEITECRAIAILTSDIPVINRGFGGISHAGLSRISRFSRADGFENGIFLTDPTFFDHKKLKDGYRAVGTYTYSPGQIPPMLKSLVFHRNMLVEYVKGQVG